MAWPNNEVLGYGKQILSSDMAYLDFARHQIVFIRCTSIKRPLNFCGLSREKIFHEREKKHDFVKTWQKNDDTYVFCGKTFPITLYRCHCTTNLAFEYIGKETWREVSSKNIVHRKWCPDVWDISCQQNNAMCFRLTRVVYRCSPLMYNVSRISYVNISTLMNPPCDTSLVTLL